MTTDTFLISIFTSLASITFSSPEILVLTSNATIICVIALEAGREILQASSASVIF
jgi:hypothetical protein